MHEKTTKGQCTNDTREAMQKARRIKTGAEPERLSLPSRQTWEPKEDAQIDALPIRRRRRRQRRRRVQYLTKRISLVYPSQSSRTDISGLETNQ